MKFINSFYLPSGRIFLLETNDGYPIECTEMRDVSVQGKQHCEVRNTQNPHIIWKHLKPYEEKWLLTVSTQKGCVHNCKFCDVADLKFKGNLTKEEILNQISFILCSTPYVEKSEKVKIGFARMGEPAHNLYNVLSAINELPSFNFNKKFDSSFRKIFGDDRIDYASNYTFVKPKRSKLVNNILIYKPIKENWADTYFGRMCKFRDSFNQVENVLNILKKKQNTKRCEIIIYDPIKDAKNMYRQPCLLTIDIKPRNGKLYITAFFRSQRVSKSGYADYTALINFGEFLAEESDMELKEVTIIAGSSHLGSQNNELKNSKKLLKELEEKNDFYSVTK